MVRECLAFFEEQRDRAAGEIASFGEMLRRSARTLDENRSTMIGQYAEGAADESRSSPSGCQPLARHDG